MHTHLHPIRWLRHTVNDKVAYYKALNAEFNRLKAEHDATPTLPAATITYHPPILHDPEMQHPGDTTSQGPGAW